MELEAVHSPPFTLEIKNVWTYTSFLPLISSRDQTVLNYWIFLIIRWHQNWPKFLQVIFCYCSYTFAAQLLRGAFHLDISFICWFGVIRVLFCVLWSLHSWRSQWSGTRYQEIPQQLYKHLWGAFLNMSLRYACFIDGTFCGNKQNFWPWDYSPTMPDYQHFRSTAC